MRNEATRETVAQCLHIALTTPIGIQGQKFKSSFYNFYNFHLCLQSYLKYFFILLQYFTTTWFVP
jgi:hypothetical protein